MNWKDPSAELGGVSIGTGKGGGGEEKEIDKAKASQVFFRDNSKPSDVITRDKNQPGKPAVDGGEDSGGWNRS